MTTNAIVSAELRQALEEARPSFLNKKITIDDVSRDIKALEDELNRAQVTGDYAEVFSSVYYIPEGEEDYFAFEEKAPTFFRGLAWKKHGERWRLFYTLQFQGWQAVNQNDPQWVQCSGSEAKAWEAAEITTLFDSRWPQGILVNKPLIDASTEIRISAHAILPDFVKSFARKWEAQKYSQEALVQ